MKKRVRKRRKDDELERLHKQVRDLKAENRALHKRLKRVTKGYRAYLDREPLEEEKEAPKEEIKVCWECSKGVLEKKVVLNRYWRECTVCNKRTTVKIIND